MIVRLGLGVTFSLKRTLKPGGKRGYRPCWSLCLVERLLESR